MPDSNPGPALPQQPGATSEPPHFFSLGLEAIVIGSFAFAAWRAGNCSTESRTELHSMKEVREPANTVQENNWE